LYITIKGISKNINEISQSSSLTLKEIKQIKKILRDRFKKKFIIDNFLKIYFKNLLTNFSYITFIGLGLDPAIRKGKRKEIESIFVKPFFSLTSVAHLKLEANCEKKIGVENDDFKIDDKIKYDNLFNRSYNYVILGSPGAGKSLLVKSLICNIAKTAINSAFNINVTEYIPFRIELRNYLVFKKSNGGNLLKYLANSLQEEFSIPSIIEENLLEVFSNRKTLVFFDGLDEIFNAIDKIQIKNDIENIHNSFPKIRSITTSRFVGYSEAKLNEEKFCELNILAFNTDQIVDYVNKWYVHEEENVDIRKDEVEGFISRMDSIDKEIISNPLLLSLVVILYRNNLSITDSKLDIYQSCTNTLVDKWDASKNLLIELDDSIIQKKEPIFADLAFWQYESLSSKNPLITYSKAKDTIANSLVKKNVADEFNCHQLAESFLNYAQKRSIYFDNNFTHKTFLEYYTAYWIYTNIEKKHRIDNREELLRKYISNPFWYIVIELLFNMIDKDQPDCEIIDGIFSEQMIYSDSLAFLNFVVPNIKNVSKSILIEIYNKTIIYLAKSYDDFLQDPNDEKIMGYARDVATRLQTNLYDEDQRDLIIQAIVIVDKNIEKENRLGFYILLNELNFSPRQFKDSTDLRKFLIPEVYNSFIRSNSYLYILDNINYTDELPDGKFITIYLDFIDLFGKTEFFVSKRAVYDSYFLFSFMNSYIYRQLKTENITSIIPNLELLESKNVNPVDLIKIVIKENLHLYSSSDAINKLYDLSKMSDISEPIKIFILLIIISVFLNHNRPRRHPDMQLSDLNFDQDFREFLDSIKTWNFTKILGSVVEKFHIKDEQILVLLKKKK
jgi:hypothetical protein